MQERTEEPKATNAARRKAEKLGVDLSQFEGSGPGGLTTINDVTDAANR
jgi:pyruvate/2-oxoglutarate dehydrogenase complex dihydrolipoamide acyltransferase (E2) component